MIAMTVQIKEEIPSFSGKLQVISWPIAMISLLDPDPVMDIVLQAAFTARNGG